MTDPSKIIGKKGKNKTQVLEEESNPDTKIDEMPEVPEKPDVNKIKPERKIPDSMKELKDIMESISDSNADQINEALEKNVDFEKAARDLWIVKESEKPSFKIKMKVPIDPKSKVIRWKRDENGKMVYEFKEFYYSGVTVVEKDIHANLLMEREFAKYELSQLTLKLKDAPTPENKLEWMKGSQEIYHKVQKYNVTIFKDYFGATDDDINRMNIDDIINYNDVAIYIEGTRHPQ